MNDHSTRVGGESTGRLPVVALVTVAFATFISVTIEMLPTGLMHLMAPDLGVSNAAIGMLMTVFAFTVVIASTPLTHLTRKVPRHALLVSVLAIFAIGSIGTATVQTYELVVVTRIVTGLAHGVFWAVVASYTALIAPPAQLTKAISITLGGGSAAYVLGVPIGTALGQLFGWRLTFGVLAVIALVVAALLWRLLPRVDHRAEAAEPEHPLELQPAPTGPIAIIEEFGDHDTADAQQPAPSSTAPSNPAPSNPAPSNPAPSNAVPPEAEPPEAEPPRAAPARPRGTASGRPDQSLSRVITVCILTGVIMLAQYAAFSYISPYVIEIIGVPEVALSFVLFGYGIASAAGTLLTGVLFSRRRALGFVITFALMLAGVGTLALAPPVWLGLVAVVVWGIGMGFMPPLLQTTLLTVAPPRIRDVSSALYTSGFNFGIGAGAFVGGMILDLSGLHAIMPFFVVVIAAAFAAWGIIVARRRRTAQP